MKLRREHEHTASRMVLLVVLVLTAGAVLSWCEGRKARAQDDGPSLLVARACFLEASWSKPDCAAIVWMARKRAERVNGEWASVLRAYAALDSGTPRAREVSGYPWGDVPGKPEAFNRRWADLRDLAARLVSGEVPDPCPDARHFGSPYLAADIVRAQRAMSEGRWVLARCSERTANVFYREIKR